MEKEFFDKLRELVMKETVEYCGNLITDENGGYFNTGEIWKGKEGVCEFKEEKTENFFHTHPITSKSYPSYEDIESIVKSRKMSIIATYWGIWFVYKTENQANCANRDVIFYTFPSMYEEHNVKFHKNVTKPEGSSPRCIEYNEHVKRLIKEFIEDMNRILSKYCTIKFVSWKSINHIRHEQGISYFSFAKKTKKSTKKTKKSVKKTKKSAKKTKKSAKNTKKSVKRVGKK